MRIQPVDSQVHGDLPIRNDAVKPPPVFKLRLKRLFDRPLNSVLKISSAADKSAAAGVEKDGGATTEAAEFEPSSVCLDKMVRSFMEENNNNEKQQSAAAATTKGGLNRCNCFSGNSNESSDDEFDSFFDSVTANNSPFNDPSDSLKGLIPCASIVERNLLADTSKIVDKNRNCKQKNELRKIVVDDLVALHYDASICKSKWEKSSSIPAGEYEYIDVIMDGERHLIDIDFRSEFEIARSTSSYKGTLHSLPYIFVGKSDRLVQIVSIVSEAARQSLKKKGMHIAPWRRAEYMKSKWLSPHTRITTNNTILVSSSGKPEPELDQNKDSVKILEDEFSELDLIFGENTVSLSSDSEEAKLPSTPAKVPGNNRAGPPSIEWLLPAVKPKSLERGNRMVVTGLASLLNDKL